MGFYSVDYLYTELNLWVDSLDVGGQAIEAQVSYDWTGDGTWDRTEIIGVFTPNDIPNYEQWHAIGLPAPKGQLAAHNGGWSNLENGTVRLQVWSAYPTYPNFE